jgi:hypothetical protein
MSCIAPCKTLLRTLVLITALITPGLILGYLGQQALLIWLNANR